MISLFTRSHKSLFVTAILGLALSLAVQAESEAVEKGKPNPFGVFNFDIGRLGNTPLEQAEALTKIGFAGVTLTFNGDRKKVDQNFADFREVSDKTGFRVYAAHQAIHLGKNPHGNLQDVRWAVKNAKSVDADFWLIVLAEKGYEVPRAELLGFINSVADLCQAEGVRCVLYPHDNTLIQSAEEAVETVKELQRDDLSISFHLCHEIRAGNGDRLLEVAKAVKPYIRLATISGADNGYVDNSPDWSQTIQPLDMGTYDPSKFIQALQSINYTGPVILHTFGLHKAEADHHRRSFVKYQELFR